MCGGGAVKNRWTLRYVEMSEALLGLIWKMQIIEFEMQITIKSKLW